MITNELTRLKSHHYIYSDFNFKSSESLSDKKKAVWEISFKNSKPSHEERFFCHKKGKVNVCEVLYHSVALTTMKL